MAITPLMCCTTQSSHQPWPVSTSESWGVNIHIVQCVSPISL